MLDADAIVVGGGPGGSSTALQLARGGHSVLLLDRARFPRDKVCGEGLMPYGVAELERLGITIDAPPFVGITYRVGGETAVGRFPGGLVGLGVRRSRLDLALARACEAAGVRRLEGARVRDVGGWPGRMWVTTGDRMFRSRVLVGADGMRSVVRKRLGLQRPSRGRPRYGLRGHFRLAEGVELPTTVEVTAADGLELYITPTGCRELNVAVLLERAGSRALAGDLEQGFRRIARSDPRIADLLHGAEPCSKAALTGPLRQEARRVADDGVVLVGDAAGFLDGITGEGMSLTLLSARIAADVVGTALTRGDLSRRALRAYSRRRAWASRDLTLLTEIVLAGIRHRWLARRVVRGLARHPEVFERVLAVNTGRSGLRDVGIRNVLKVLR